MCAQEVTIRGGGLKHVACAEDEDFIQALDKMMLENLQVPPGIGRPSLSVLFFPTNLRRPFIYLFIYFLGGLFLPQQRSGETVKVHQLDVAIPLQLKSQLKKGGSAQPCISEGDAEVSNTMQFVMLTRKGNKQQVPGRLETETQGGGQSTLGFFFSVGSR